MEEKRIKANWNDYPPVEECTDMGDKNGNVMDVELIEKDDRTIAMKDNK